MDSYRQLNRDMYDFMMSKAAEAAYSNDENILGFIKRDNDEKYLHDKYKLKQKDLHDDEENFHASILTPDPKIFGIYGR